MILAPPIVRALVATSAEMVVARSTQEAIVVAVDDDPFAPQHIH